jgi:N-acetylmuramoyl-L-alanine amidase CwlA
MYSKFTSLAQRGGIPPQAAKVLTELATESKMQFIDIKVYKDISGKALFRQLTRDAIRFSSGKELYESSEARDRDVDNWETAERTSMSSSEDRTWTRL